MKIYAATSGFFMGSAATGFTGLELFRYSTVNWASSSDSIKSIFKTIQVSWNFTLLKIVNDKREPADGLGLQVHRSICIQISIRKYTLVTLILSDWRTWLYVLAYPHVSRNSFWVFAEVPYTKLLKYKIILSNLKGTSALDFHIE